MDTAEVVVGEVQAVRGPEVLPLLAERICQPREAAHLHSDGEVLAFHMAGANRLGSYPRSGAGALRCKFSCIADSGSVEVHYDEYQSVDTARHMPRKSLL